MAKRKTETATANPAESKSTETAATQPEKRTVAEWVLQKLVHPTKLPGRPRPPAAWSQVLCTKSRAKLDAYITSAAPGTYRVAENGKPQKPFEVSG